MVLSLRVLLEQTTPFGKNNRLDFLFIHHLGVGACFGDLSR
jgi:hypothetical protein